MKAVKQWLSRFWARLRLLLLVTILLLLMLAAGGLWLWSDYKTFVNQPLTLPDEGAVFELKPGTTLPGLLRQWADRGWIKGGWRQARYLQVIAKRRGLATRLKAGEYHLAANSRPEQALRVLASGKVVQHHLTLIEGWSFKEMMAALRANKVLEHRLADDSPETVMKAIGRQGQPAEGYFLPDTWAFPRGTTDVQFLRRANRALESLLEKAWQDRAEALPYENAAEALVMASIVEKETAVAQERPMIAGVFVRRLKLGMRLQTDPTVIYGMGDAYKGNLRRKDLRRDTPWNTYTRKGLPPTPIALASAAAIQAALHPASGRSLYFVARGNGEHQFSATLEEHNRAVRRYQIRKRVKNYRSTPKALTPEAAVKPAEAKSPLAKPGVETPARALSPAVSDESSGSGSAAEKAP